MMCVVFEDKKRDSEFVEKEKEGKERLLALLLPSTGFSYSSQPTTLFTIPTTILPTPQPNIYYSFSYNLVTNKTTSPKYLTFNLLLST
jgi:hypothetical protein